MRTYVNAAAMVAVLASALSFSPTVMAGASDYVATAVVEEGEREIDFKAGTVKLADGTRASAQSLGLGWGPTSWWFTEVYAKWHKEPEQRQSFDAWEWENKFQLTETGKYPVDVAILLEIERPNDRSEGYEYRWGPLLQAELSSDVQGNLNLLFEKHIGSSEPSKAEFAYQWQLKYRWKPAFEVGAQGFGEVGPWSHWSTGSEQSHIAGPAVFGRVGLGAHQAIKYNAGWLFGLNNGSPRQTLRLQTEFEF